MSDWWHEHCFTGPQDFDAVIEAAEAQGFSYEGGHALKGDPHERRDPVSQVELEQAWRNGWGSALNFLRAADRLAKRNTHDPATAAIISDLIDKYVAIIDRTTDEAVEQAREIGFAAPPEGTTHG